MYKKYVEVISPDINKLSHAIPSLNRRSTSPIHFQRHFNTILTPFPIQVKAPR